mmetsp:Transcript_12365/g.22493  ORF Transcript_12365/g.22493 Transcript_12365/m.22493 type:complete len:82 (+) Transcript_12365:1572-1817(+)
MRTSSSMLSTNGKTMNARLFLPNFGMHLNLAHVPLSVNRWLLIQTYHNHTWLVGELIAREQRKSTRNFCGVVSLEVSQALE